MENLRIVFFGTPDFVVPVLEALNKHFTVIGVVTSPVSPTPVEVYAKLHNIPTLTQEELKNINADLFVIAAYGKIIPQSIIDNPKYKTLNIHPSLLPKYRGTSPIQNAILNGDKISGITIMQVDEKMDHGPILIQEEFELSEEDTTESLHSKMFQKGAEMLIVVIPRYIQSDLKPEPQDHLKATFTKMIKKENGYFDINNPPSPKILGRMIRAYYPWPTAWTKWPFDKAQGKKYKIVKFLPEKKIQIEGKKPMNIKEFLNGYPNFPKELLDSLR